MWVQLLEALSCKTLYTHVLNAMTCHSNCCGWCACDCETEQVAVSDDDDDVELRVGCCGNSVEYIED
jgi:hypothetical protein